MGRAPRIDLGDYAYHIINRANKREKMFHTAAEYADFEYLLKELVETFDMRILAYVIMPNHWHLLLYPRHDGDVGKAMHWLTTSHVRRHHSRKKTIGHGHLYQGSYKSFLIETDVHLLTVLKYIERNPVRALLADSVESWRWGSAYHRKQGARNTIVSGDLPVPLPKDYWNWVNMPEPAELLEELRRNVEKGTSYGDVLVPNNTMPHKSAS